AFKEVLLEDGWPSTEQFDAVMDNTSTAELQRALAGVRACQEQLRLLAEAADTRFVIKRGRPDGTELNEPLLSFARAIGVAEQCRQVTDGTLSRRAPQAGAEESAGS